MLKILMYSTGCSKCQVLQRKLNEKRIEYEKVSDINLMREKGIQSVPVLQVGGTRLNFAEAVKCCMNINIKLDKNFTVAFNKMIEKYGQKMRQLNGFSEKQLNYTDFIDNFVDKNTVADASIDGNANVGVKDITSLQNQMSKPHLKLLSFNKIFYELNKKYGYHIANEWLEAEWNGVFYLHDAFSSSLKSYCNSYDLTDLAKKGLYFINNFNAQPPKHLTTFTDFVTQYISWVSNRTSGGCSIPNFFVWSFYFWKKDIAEGYYMKSPQYYRDQEFQRHIYKLNQPFVRIIQCAYVTQTIMDRSYLEELFGGMEYPDGTFVIDYIDQILQYEKAFMDVVHKIRSQNMSTFPVLTYSLLFDYKKNKFVHQDFARWCSDANSYWMDANFSIDDTVTSLASCCRLRNDIKDISLGKFSSIGGSALQVGSVKVNSINLARIAYETNGNEQEYLRILKQRCELCCKVLDVIRHIIIRNVQKGLLPNYNLKMIDINKQYSTIGICALFETIKRFGYIEYDEFGCLKYKDEGLQFAKKIFDVISKVKLEYSQKTGYRYNIEQIPGQRACAIFLQKDKCMFPNQIIEKSLYSNQWISLGQKTTVEQRVRVGQVLDSYLGGGVIFHCNMDAPFNNTQTAWKLLNYIAKHHIPYFAFNGKQSACEHNHGFYGDICPQCGGKMKTQWTRVVGFSVPVKAMSKQRREQFGQRQWGNPLDFDKYFD